MPSFAPLRSDVAVFMRVSGSNTKSPNIKQNEEANTARLSYIAADAMYQCSSWHVNQTHHHRAHTSQGYTKRWE